MSRHLGLRTRVRRLERGKVKRPRRSIIFALYDTSDDRVTGLDTIAGQVVERRWGEGLDDLVSRARTGVGPRQVLLMRYPPSSPAQAPCEAPSAIADPEPVPVAFDRATDDWRGFRDKMAAHAPEPFTEPMRVSAAVGHPTSTPLR
ncbi:hypothetical protein [Sphingomonas endophytica]|uniref:hypothetical protein n=1 Tax=Sphingomonas endophytica TaxID=869719 RepID=UPI00128FAF7B|nr:hypothetical protein [Sphingomonas endophytica]